MVVVEAKINGLGEPLGEGAGEVALRLTVNHTTNDIKAPYNFVQLIPFLINAQVNDLTGLAVVRAADNDVEIGAADVDTHRARAAVARCDVLAPAALEYLLHAETLMLFVVSLAQHGVENFLETAVGRVVKGPKDLRGVDEGRRQLADVPPHEILGAVRVFGLPPAPARVELGAAMGTGADDPAPCFDQAIREGVLQTSPPAARSAPEVPEALVRLLE